MKKNCTFKAILACILLTTTLITMSSVVSAKFVENILNEMIGTNYITSSSEEDEDKIEPHNCGDYTPVTEYFNCPCGKQIISYYCGKCSMPIIGANPPHICKLN